MAGSWWSLQSYAHIGDLRKSHLRMLGKIAHQSPHGIAVSGNMLCTCMDAPTVSMLLLPMSTVHVRRCMMLDLQSYCVSVFVNDNAVTAAESSRCATARQCGHTLAVHLQYFAARKTAFRAQANALICSLHFIMNASVYHCAQGTRKQVCM